MATFQEAAYRNLGGELAVTAYCQGKREAIHLVERKLKDVFQNAKTKSERELIRFILGGMQAIRNELEVCDGKTFAERIGDGVVCLKCRRKLGVECCVDTGHGWICHSCA